MQGKSRTRWAALLLAAGTILFSMATILGEPFEQNTVSSLVRAITENRALFTVVNLLATVGLVTVIVGFAILTTAPLEAGRRTRPRAYGIGLGLLVAACAFWIAEVVFRVRLAYSGAVPVTGENEPDLLTTVGVGWNAIFLTFLALALAGIAVLMWGLGDDQMVPPRLARLGAVVVIGSGVLAALFYPWVGEVERALFYPLVLVVLPTAIYLLRRRSRSDAQADAP